MDSHIKGRLADNSYLALMGQLVVLLADTPTQVAKIEASVAEPVLIEMLAIPPKYAAAGYSGGTVTINGDVYAFAANPVRVVLTSTTIISPAKAVPGDLTPYFVLRVVGFGTKQ